MSGLGDWSEEGGFLANVYVGTSPNGNWEIFRVYQDEDGLWQWNNLTHNPAVDSGAQWIIE